ncbi:MAG: ATP synthase subunit I [Candidatus Acidiferrales bacterium]
MAGEAQYELTERRIARLTVMLGAAASVAACFLYSIRVGAGLLIGALLAWVNFHWLERAMDSVVRASTAQAGSPEARVPVSSYFGLFARYALIAVVVYVTFSFFRIPVLSMLLGLCALGVAAMLATLIEVLSPNSESH